MLRVTEADIRRVLSFSITIEKVRDAYVKLARGQAANPARTFLQVPHGASMYIMPGYLSGQRTVSVKVARANTENWNATLPTVLSTVYVYDSINGVQIAEVEGEWLTTVRTAASTAVATDAMARKNVHVLGVLGAGTEATAHIPALKLVRDFDSVLVYSRDRRRREMFAKKATRDNRIPVVAVDSPDRVASESDVIVTATTSTIPVFDGTLVRAGAHVNAIGSATPKAREVDSQLVSKSKVVVDSRTQALATYGDIMTPLAEGKIRESEIMELGELLVGKSRPSNVADDITLFKAGGLAVLDAILTDFAVSRISRGHSREN